MTPSLLNPARRLLAGSVGLLVVLLTGCSDGGSGTEPMTEGAALPVTVSIAPQAAFVQAIGGDLVDVTVMVPPSSEPATYEPKPQQVAALAGSEAYFSIGVPFEQAWLPRFQAAAPDVPVVDTTQGVERRTLGAGKPDPHIWLDPVLVQTQAETYAKALKQLDPAHTADYDAGLADFQRALTELDADLTEMLAPYAGDSFMIFHPVLNYFADQYELLPINIEADGDEPSASAMQDLIETGREKEVAAVLVEPQFSQRAARTIADQLSVPVETVDPLATDWADNMRAIGNTLAESLATSA